MNFSSFLSNAFSHFNTLCSHTWSIEIHSNNCIISIHPMCIFSSLMFHIIQRYIGTHDYDFVEKFCGVPCRMFLSFFFCRKYASLQIIIFFFLRGGKICLTDHFKPLWARNVPKFGIAHAMALGVSIIILYLVL